MSTLQQERSSSLHLCPLRSYCLFSRKKFNLWRKHFVKLHPNLYCFIFGKLAILVTNFTGSAPIQTLMNKHYKLSPSPHHHQHAVPYLTMLLLTSTILFKTWNIVLVIWASVHTLYLPLSSRSDITFNHHQCLLFLLFLPHHQLLLATPPTTIIKISFLLFVMLCHDFSKLKGKVILKPLEVNVKTITSNTNCFCFQKNVKMNNQVVYYKSFPDYPEWCSTRAKIETLAQEFTW